MSKSGLPWQKIYWLTSYLRDPKGLVSVDGVLSKLVGITRGVPQGS